MKRAAAILAVAAVAGCGANTQDTYESRMAAIDRDPYVFTCGDQKDAQRFGKHAHFALADDTHVTDMPRIRVAQSVFLAIQEICKGKPRDYRPGKEAVAGVKSGKYRVHVVLYDTDR